MPGFLDRDDRRLVLGAVVAMFLLLGLTFLLTPTSKQQSIGNPSTYSTEWLGSKAAFILLQQSGYRVERWESPPEELPENAAGTTLILAEPSQASSTAERAAVSRFVSAGGRLLVMGASGATFAPESTSLAIPDSDLTPKPYQAVLPSPLSRNAPEVTMVAPDEWTSLKPSQLAIYDRAGKAGVVWYRYGKGEVIWWAIASPASNGSIREKGNLALFLNSVGPHTSRVLWDEYYHGLRRSLGSYFMQTPLPWAGFHVAFACAVVLFTFSRRWGPARMPLVQSRLSSLEFVETLGDLYESSHAAPAAVDIVYQRLRFALARSLGLTASMQLPELSRIAAARLGWPEQAFFHALSDAERARHDIHLDDKAALELVTELHRYLNLLGVQRMPAKEKS